VLEVSSLLPVRTTGNFTTVFFYVSVLYMNVQNSTQSSSSSMLRAHYIIALLSLHAFAGLVAEELIIHERVDQVSPEFTDLGPPEHNTILNLRINLVSNDLAGLDKTLNEISTPSSVTYGNWLSKEQVGIRTLFQVVLVLKA
jgi:subtilase family serine protease